MRARAGRAARSRRHGRISSLALEREFVGPGVRKRPPRREMWTPSVRVARVRRSAQGAGRREIQEVFDADGSKTMQREVVKVRETLQASQARAVAQTQEVQRNKDHIKSLLEKGDGDDELVDALRRDLHHHRCLGDLWAHACESHLTRLGKCT